MKSKLIVIGLLLAACGTVHKSQNSSSSSQVMLDTSSQQRAWEKETVTTERGMQPVITRPDTAGLYGYMPAGDTTGFFQEVETASQKVRTDVKPRRDAVGNLTGYDVSTQATTKPQQVGVPVDKKTVTREQGNLQVQQGKSSTSTQTASTSQKQRFSFNGWGAVVVVICVALLLYFIFKLIQNGIKKRIS